MSGPELLKRMTREIGAFSSGKSSDDDPVIVHTESFSWVTLAVSKAVVECRDKAQLEYQTSGIPELYEALTTLVWVKAVKNDRFLRYAEEELDRAKP